MVHYLSNYVRPMTSIDWSQLRILFSIHNNLFDINSFISRVENLQFWQKMTLETVCHGRSYREEIVCVTWPLVATRPPAADPKKTPAAIFGLCKLFVFCANPTFWWGNPGRPHAILVSGT